MVEHERPAPSVTVVVLTFNGERYLRRVLQAVADQEYDGDVETLVIDSGSTDGTLGIVAEFPKVRLHEIPNSEFQHGRTRNLAARLATGELVAFLTQDAIPVVPGWLASLVEPLRRYDDVGGVVGRQVPRANCYPLLKLEIRAVFAAQGPDGGTSLFRHTPGTELDPVGTFYSDVNSATRRAILTGPIPYHEVAYAEDQLFGKDILNAGLAKAYSGPGAVEHSNDLTIRELRSRTFDEVVGQRRIGIEIPAPSRRGVVRGIVVSTLQTWRWTLRDRDYSPLRRLYWLVVGPAYVVTKWTSLRSSALHPLGDDGADRSLEARRRSG